MNLKHFFLATISLILIGLTIWLVHGIFFPPRLYDPEKPIAKIQIIASETPHFYYIGLDNPHFYVLKSQNFPTNFHISNEVLDLVQANDTISKAIKEIKYGDTLQVYIDSSSFKMLNRNMSNLEILGLVKGEKWVIQPEEVEKYFRERKANNQFTIIVIALICYFIYRKRRSNKARNQLVN